GRRVEGEDVADTRGRAVSGGDDRVDVRDELVEIDLALPGDGRERGEVDGGRVGLAEGLARVEVGGVVEEEGSDAGHAQRGQFEFDADVRVRLHVRARGHRLGERFLQESAQGPVGEELVGVDVAAQAAGEVREARVDLAAAVLHVAHEAAQGAPGARGELTGEVAVEDRGDVLVERGRLLRVADEGRERGEGPALVGGLDEIDALEIGRASCRGARVYGG